MADNPATPNSAYLHAELIDTTEVIEVPEVNTVVHKLTDHPMSEMPAVFDATFQVLFSELANRGITPTGPAFSLHYRLPTETATFEVGVPVDRALDNEFTAGAGVTLTPSTLPAGKVARVSRLGGYEGLGPAWGDFIESVTAAAETPDLPFWEVYITEPTPDTDPATLRTDLYTRIVE